MYKSDSGNPPMITADIGELCGKVEDKVEVLHSISLRYLNAYVVGSDMLAKTLVSDSQDRFPNRVSRPNIIDGGIGSRSRE
jgi:hypothetical protein